MNDCIPWVLLALGSLAYTLALAWALDGKKKPEAVRLSGAEIDKIVRRAGTL